MSLNFKKYHKNSNHQLKGLTLLELLIAVFVISLISAMVWPALGHLGSSTKIVETKEIMDEIENAIIGPKGRYDENGRPVISGFVGDMKRWPWLWEARPEVRPGFAGTGWEDPGNISPGSGLGKYSGEDSEGPLYDLDYNNVFFRPDGEFNNKKWQWKRPFRRVHADAENEDHTGGPETENEGQPRGLWTKYVEDYPYSDREGYILGDEWKGPYLRQPYDDKLSDAEHFAKDNHDYATLEPIWHNSGSHSNRETWEDGCYSPSSGELGEGFDDKERFRLLQTDERLKDAWGRALRFFITDDPENSGGTIFWIISEGPDHDGVYPAKGICTSHMWVTDPDDTMENNYNPDLPENRDNIVRKLRSFLWEKAFEEDDSEKTEATINIVNSIKKAISGNSPHGYNTGFTSHLKNWPALYNYEANAFKYKTDSEERFNIGYPSGLFNKDYCIQSSPFSFGTGWRHNYLDISIENYDDEFIYDAWGSKIVCFYDSNNNSFMILSPGPDCVYSFYENAHPKDDIDLDSYEDSHLLNKDNITLKVDFNDWMPGFLTIEGITVLNCDPTAKIKAAIYGIYDDNDPYHIQLTLVDADSDGQIDDYQAGSSVEFNDLTSEKLVTGLRYLIIWNDENENNLPDNSESGLSYLHNVGLSPLNCKVEEDYADFNRTFQ